MMDDLSLEEKVGQLVMAGIKGTSLDAETEELLVRYRVGGFIFFARNLDSPKQARALVDSVKAANPSPQPLLLAVDEEGGSVSRLPGEFVPIPSGRRLGKKGSAELTRAVGQVWARRLKLLGFNLNFAPVLDVDSNPANPVIGSRSYGAKPELVARLGVAAWRGMEAENVISACKHFPGHGDTAVDSHLGLPAVDADLDRLRRVELIPFQRAIKAGAQMIMTAHILLPKLDPLYPATLSAAIIGNLLRQELNFQGVVITDDLTMAAIEKNYALGEAAVRAINAGVDIVLVCHGSENYRTVLNAIRAAAQTGDISPAALYAAVARVLNLKKRLGQQTAESAPVADIAFGIAASNRQVRRILQGL